MYERYYGLSEKPFSLTPDTEFFYRSFTHQQALNVLLVAIRSGDGFIKVTGEVGTGKTLLCRKLLDALEAEYDTVYIPNPYLTSSALLDAVLSEMGITQKPKGNNHLARINDYLLASARRNRATVIILDEAQALPEECLEAIRLLSNLETGKRKLVQIVLFGQPELDTRLAQSNIRQLRQRIMHAYQLQPLNRDSVRSYLLHRIKSAGYRGPELFDHGALRRLHKFSQGIPRVINVLCNKALMLAYASGEFYVTRKHIEAAAADSQLQ
ncbi:MAG: AAA family ATPase [Gammaproteobacteria bacterium]|nr:AAA family ATPase [Gammaproteobacteria bacterium]MDH3449073.1 AAA family ATPase [Gammaproteobacteria bacterium]